MNRKILFLALVLSACATKKPLKTDLGILPETQQEQDAPVSEEVVSPDKPLQLAGSVAQILSEVAERNETEIIGCLTIDADNTVTAVRFPPLWYSRSNGVGLAEPCDTEKERGFWHNHPPSSRLPSGPLRAQVCHLSRLDVIQSSDFDFAVVHVDRETWCWWTKEQIASSLLYMVMAIPGQVKTWSPRAAADRETPPADFCAGWTIFLWDYARHEWVTGTKNGLSGRIRRTIDPEVRKEECATH